MSQIAQKIEVTYSERNCLRWKDQSGQPFQSFACSQGKLKVISGTTVLAAEEVVQKVKVLQSLTLVASDFSCSSANGGSDQFRLMFLDSEIARSYKQEEFKVRYSIQNGIASYFKEHFFWRLQKIPFSFQFKESNSSQIKKQYGSYVRYWLLQHDKVVTA